jgi:hypothetical protein
MTWSASQDRPEVQERRALWRAAIIGLDVSRLVFIDETWPNTTLSTTALPERPVIRKPGVARRRRATPGNCNRTYADQGTHGRFGHNLPEHNLLWHNLPKNDMPITGIILGKACYIALVIDGHRLRPCETTIWQELM